MEGNGKNPRPAAKVLVIGIDAATLKLMRPWADAGHLPTFAKLFAEGATGELQSVPNRNSAASWTSIMTGKNPGKHGIFFFTEFEEKSLDYVYVNGSFRDGASLWHLLGNAGVPVSVMNVPMTYPAETVFGMLVAGMDTPSTDDPNFVYPPQARNELLEKVPDYTIEVGLGSFMKAGRLDAGVEAMTQTTKARLNAAKHFMTTKVWEFFMVVFRNTDPAQHYFWKYMEPDHFDVSPEDAQKYRDVILNVYKETDAAVAELLRLVDDDTTVVIISDHGACANTASPAVVPQWLRVGGFQAAGGGANGASLSTVQRAGWNVLSKVYKQVDKRFNRDFKKRLSHRFPTLRAKTETRANFRDIDWSRTKAFADGRRPEIWINVRGRQPHGVVEPGAEYNAVCDQITAFLMSARNPTDGSKLVERVHRAADLYHGSHAEKAADLMIDWCEGAVTDHALLGEDMLVDVDVDSPAYLLDRPYSGVHDGEGILMMRGAAVQQGSTPFGATVCDIAPTVLYLLGQPIPSDMDGRPLLELLQHEVVTAHSPVIGEAAEVSASENGSGYSESDEEVIGERLRSLGYIE